jgi:type II secretory pathway component PulF
MTKRENKTAGKMWVVFYTEKGKNAAATFTAETKTEAREKAAARGYSVKSVENVGEILRNQGNIII